MNHTIGKLQEEYKATGRMFNYMYTNNAATVKDKMLSEYDRVFVSQLDCMDLEDIVSSGQHNYHT